MESIKIHITGAEAIVLHAPTVTAGMVGLPVEFSFDEAWDGLTKNAVFRAGKVIRMKTGIADTCTVAPEVLQKPFYELQIGVLGLSNDGSTVIPTIWADVGHIKESTDKDAEQTVDPENPVWVQALEKLGKVDQQIQDALQKARDSGDFQGERGDIASIFFDDDGNGNVTIGTKSAGMEVVLTDDGNGNVSVEVA